MSSSCLRRRSLSQTRFTSRGGETDQHAGSAASVLHVEESSKRVSLPVKKMRSDRLSKQQQTEGHIQLILFM